MDEDIRRSIKAVGYLSAIGLSMALAIAIGALLGNYLDKWLGTGPWLLLIFTVLGIAAAFRNLYILYKKAQRFF